MPANQVRQVASETCDWIAASAPVPQLLSVGHQPRTLRSEVLHRRVHICGRWGVPWRSASYSASSGPVGAPPRRPADGRPTGYDGWSFTRGRHEADLPAKRTRKRAKRHGFRHRMSDASRPGDLEGPAPARPGAPLRLSGRPRPVRGRRAFAGLAPIRPPGQRRAGDEYTSLPADDGRRGRPRRLLRQSQGRRRGRPESLAPPAPRDRRGGRGDLAPGAYLVGVGPGGQRAHLLTS